MRFSAGLVEVIIYSSPDDKKKNRGFCFLEYESHKAASLAKRRLGTGRIKVKIIRFVRITIGEESARAKHPISIKCQYDYNESLVFLFGIDRFGVVILLSIGLTHKKNRMNQL